MMGVACEGPTHVHGDNQSSSANTTIAESILKNRSSSLSYHLTREGASMHDWREVYAKTHVNEKFYLLVKRGIILSGRC